MFLVALGSVTQQCIRAKVVVAGSPAVTQQCIRVKVIVPNSPAVGHTVVH